MSVLSVTPHLSSSSCSTDSSRGPHLDHGVPSAVARPAALARRQTAQQPHGLSVAGLHGAQRRASVACNSAVGAATPENPEHLPDVALASQPVTAAPAEPEFAPETEQPGGLWARVKRFSGGDRIDRQRLAALGMGAVCSYGLISNLTYGGGMAVAWIAFVKRRGVSPLAAGQWQQFLAFYAGYWTLQHFVRPFRFALAVSIAPIFEKAIQYTSRRLNISKRDSFGLYLILLGTCTSILVFGSIAVFAGPQAFAR